MKQSIKSTLLYALVAVVLVGMPMQQANSAPGTLPKAPLFLSTIVEPNVFLTLDDSLSMGTSTLIPDDPTKVKLVGMTINDNNSPTMNFGGFILELEHLNPRTNVSVSGYTDFAVPPADLYHEAWILRSHLSNYTYYNPDVIYGIWAGVDSAGNPYKEYQVSAGGKLVVPMNPYYPGVDLYDLLQTYTYHDRNEKSTNNYYIPTYYTPVTPSAVVDASAAYVETRITKADTVQIQNFSNWFVYHRTREFAMKAAIGKIVNNTDSFRMGMRLFNGGHKAPAATMSDPTNKANLLKELYSITSYNYPANYGVTPGRRALELTGLMFEDSDPTTAPILSAAEGGNCQQNFNILMSDGYWNGDPPTWNTKSPKDTNNTDTHSIDPKAISIFDGDASQSNDGGNYADAYEDTLADVAMHFYENDLRIDLLDEVPTREGIDEATHQHLVNYVVSFGLTGSLDTTVDPADTVNFPGWTDPTTGNAQKVDDLWHTAYNSRGELLSVNGGSSDLESAIANSLSDISEITGTITASVAVNSAKLSTESIVYLATFYSDGWWGNLEAFPIIDTDTGELQATPDWDASNVLDNRISPRIINTFNSTTKAGIPFEWASRSADMEADLSKNPNGLDDALGPDRLDFIRGNRNFEGTNFRVRKSLLGDIVNSNPVYVGTPNLAWPDRAPFPESATGTPYSDFKAAKVNRPSRLYVGANDGMLHAFDEKGQEAFAYIPGLVYSANPKEGLHYLTDPNYIHNFYVDLAPTVSDVYISSGGSTQWHTVLVGGLRGGGKGLFALDITTPETYSQLSPKPDLMSLWEFTSDDDAALNGGVSRLGYTFARPSIGLSNAGTWVAIFGNGYNSDSGEASLFIVDIEKGTDGNWVAGDYTVIGTGVGSAGAKNGLSTPALGDTDGNGTIDRAYAGDLEGNMWVFDLSGSTPGSWDVAYRSGGTPAPLFTTAANQPITAKPVLASHPTVSDSTQNDPNIMVFFGTGQYLVSGDKITTDVQAFHGVWDHGKSLISQVDLVQQNFDATFSGRVLSREPVDYSTHDGWYFNLPDSGERAVTSPIARADTVFFNTFVPGEDVCDRGGYGWRFAVDMENGGSPQFTTFDSNGDGEVNEADLQVSSTGQESTLAAVRQEGFLPEPVFIEDLVFTGDQAAKIKALSTVPTGRFSWQELIF